MVIHRLLLKVVVLGALLGPYHIHIAEDDDSMSKPRCRSTCGNLSISYPIGLNDSDPQCRIRHSSFRVVCDYYTNPPVPYMNRRDSSIDILDIFVKDHELRVNILSSRDCYNAFGKSKSLSNYPQLNRLKFLISSTKNKFIFVNCDTLAFFLDSREKFSFGCMSLCGYVSDVSNGSCSGIDCCETSIPRGSFGYEISIRSFYNHTFVVDFKPCSYAFIAQIGSYNFSVGDLKQLKFNESTLVLNWVIRNQTRKDAMKNSTSYMCTNNTICTNAENGSGYKYTCKEGYRGNPYLANSCQDIDECADPETNTCEGKCHNVDGSYTCSCPEGYHCDGKKGGGDDQGCIANLNRSHLMEILVNKCFHFTWSA